MSELHHLPLSDSSRLRYQRAFKVKESLPVDVVDQVKELSIELLIIRKTTLNIHHKLHQQDGFLSNDRWLIDGYLSLTQTYTNLDG